MRGSKMAMMPGSRRAASTRVEHLRVGELGLEDLLDDVFVRGAELRLVVDAGARFLVDVVAGFGGDDHGDLRGRRHDERLGQVAFGAHGDGRATAEHHDSGANGMREMRMFMVGRSSRGYSFTNAAG